VQANRGGGAGRSLEDMRFSGRVDDGEPTDANDPGEHGSGQHGTTLLDSYKALFNPQSHCGRGF
jgi:hypothetical protein